MRDSRFDLGAGSTAYTRMLVVGSTLHLLYAGSGSDIASHAWGINAGSLTRLSSEDLDAVATLATKPD